MSILYDEKQVVFTQAEAFPLPVANPLPATESVSQLPPDSVASFPTQQDNPDIVTLKQYQSPNYVKNLSGWMTDSDGNAEFNNGTFRGTFILGGALITIDDISKLQSSMDSVNSLGGGTVSLVPGTYSLSSSPTLSSNVTIDGNGATIDFGGGAYQLLAQGTNPYSTGTLSVNYGSGAVTGVGTTWTAAMIGQSILIGDYWYTITARASNTSITISPGFMAPNVSGATYVIATTVDNISIRNLTLTNASGTLFKFRYINGLVMDSFFNDTAAQAIDGDDSANVQWTASFIDSCTVGMTFDNVPFCTLDNSAMTNITGGTAMALNGVTNTSMGVISIQAVTGVGVTFTNCSNLGFINFSIIECSSHGIQFISGNSDLSLDAGYFNSCGGDAIRLTASSSRLQIVGNSIINNTGWGVNIVDSSSSSNQITGNDFSNNTAGDLNDMGTNTIVEGNSPASVNSTIGVRIIAAEPITQNDLVAVASTAVTGNSNSATDGVNTFGKNSIGNSQTAFSFYGSGVAMSSLKVNLKESGSPVDNAVIRVETDNAGVPSGTLANVNATASIAGSNLTTNYVDTTVTFAGSFTLTIGVRYWLVFKRSGALQNPTYYLVGTRTSAINPVPQYATADNTGTWTAQTYGEALYISATGFITNGLVRNRSSILNNGQIGFANTTSSAGSFVPVTGRGGVINTMSGLTPGFFYPPSATAGQLGTATDTSGTQQAGQAVTPTSLQVLLRPA